MLNTFLLTESTFYTMAREEIKFKTAKQLWVCAKGKGECLGLQGLAL